MNSKKERFGIPELRNQVTQNGVALPVNNSKIFTESLISSY